MKISDMRREVERPFKNKQILRVKERFGEEILHAWLYKLTMDGGITIATYDKGEDTPDWLEGSEYTSSSIRGVPNS